MNAAAAEGKGAVSLNGRLIDAASLRMAENLLTKLERSSSAERSRSAPEGAGRRWLGPVGMLPHGPPDRPRRRRRLRRRKDHAHSWPRLASSASRSVSYVSGDDYHRYARAAARRAGHHAAATRRPTTSTSCGQHLGHLRRWEPILKPVYDHRTGTLERARVTCGRARTWSSRGCSTSTPSSSATPTTSASSWRRPRSCGATWKLTRDCTRRGYTTHEVLERAGSPRARRRPSLHAARSAQHADIVVSFMPEHASDRPRAPRRRRDPARHAAPPRPLAPARPRRPTARRSMRARARVRCCEIPGRHRP